MRTNPAQDGMRRVRRCPLFQGIVLSFLSPWVELKSVATSVPEPPLKKSAPKPPVSLSAPALPSSLSSPAPPLRMSSPRPPSREILCRKTRDLALTRG